MSTSEILFSSSPTKSLMEEYPTMGLARHFYWYEIIKMVISCRLKYAFHMKPFHFDHLFLRVRFISEANPPPLSPCNIKGKKCITHVTFLDFRKTWSTFVSRRKRTNSPEDKCFSQINRLVKADFQRNHKIYENCKVEFWFHYSKKIIGYSIKNLEKCNKTRQFHVF